VICVPIYRYIFLLIVRKTPQNIQNFCCRLLIKTSFWCHFYQKWSFRDCCLVRVYNFYHVKISYLIPHLLLGIVSGVFRQRWLGSLLSSLWPLDHCWLQNVQVAEKLCDDKRCAGSPLSEAAASGVSAPFVERHAGLQRLDNASGTQLREVCQRELISASLLMFCSCFTSCIRHCNMYCIYAEFVLQCFWHCWAIQPIKIVPEVALCVGGMLCLTCSFTVYAELKGFVNYVCLRVNRCFHCFVT